VHYYAAGYYYAAKNKGIAMPSGAQAYGSFATPGSIKFSSERKLRAAYAQDGNTARSWSLYSGSTNSY
jgi:hypothetical protein